MKLYQKRSGNLARLNYLMALPLCAGMLCASSAAFSKNYGVKFDWGSAPASITNHVIAKKDSVKKLRLKVTSGNTWGITDKLKLSGAGGKELVYTAQTLTAQDKKELKQKFGIDVETTNATGSTTSIMVLPPPPPIDARNPNKIRRPIIPPPPPPTEKRASAKSKSNIPPPPPPVEGGLEQNDLTPDEQTKLKQGGRIVTLSFQDLLKHVNKTMRYPAEAKKNNITGSLLTSFQVDENREISNVAIKHGTNTILDAEAEKALSSYKGKVIAKSGIYTMRLSFKLQHADGTVAQTFGNKADLETATAGEITVTAYSEKD